MAGKRKTAVARATIKKGKGMIRINSVPLDSYKPEFAKLKIEESLLFASDFLNLDKIDIAVNVRGGGVMGQADAVRSSIARGLVDFLGGGERGKGKGLLEAYVGYDRTMIAGDHRHTEPHKPGQSRKGPRHRRQKSYR